MRNTAKLMTVMVALSVTSTFAADWPWIYGPRRDNTSDQKGLLRSWPEAGPKVLWTAPVGVGFGGPLASAVVLEQGDKWAPLALVDGMLLLRGQKELKCLQVAQ